MDNREASLVPKEIQFLPSKQKACALRVIQEAVQLGIKGT